MDATQDGATQDGAARDGAISSKALGVVYAFMCIIKFNVLHGLLAKVDGASGAISLVALGLLALAEVTK